ncbi:adhesion G-protein coupled receptor G2 [Emydura macquarii macquarii]|uniref:adhesion G-protein coupled receptor G2 n=1 Tax=Emydura macquarii macquarii TaxID=1129001 RepID=UPI00352B6A2C
MRKISAIMIACGVQHCCAGRVQELLLKFKISLAIILLHLFLATSNGAQDDFLGRYRAVFKTACEDAWSLSPGIQVPTLKEFTVCVNLKLVTSNNPWTAFVYNIKRADSTTSANSYELGLTGDHDKLTVWIFGIQINLTEKLNVDTWYQVCIEWRSKYKEMKLFINGTEKRSQKLVKKIDLIADGQILLGCSQPSATSSAMGMVGELYMFRMWDKADKKSDCKDGNIIGWRKKNWVYNHTLEESNILPCVNEVSSRSPVANSSVIISDTTSLEKTSTSAESSIVTFITYPSNASATTSGTSTAARTLSMLPKPNHTETTSISEFNFSTTVESSIVTFITYPINASDMTSLERTSSEGRTLNVCLEPNQTKTTTIPELNFSTTAGKLSANVTFSITDNATLPTTANTNGINYTNCKNETKLPGYNLHNSSAICNDSVFYMGCVKFQYSEKSSNTSLNVEIFNDVITSNKVTKFTTPILQESKISEFNKTLQEQSESSFMECAAENESISVCKFIIKLSKTANISNVIAHLKDKAEISQIEQCFCLALQSWPSAAKELQILKCDGQDTVVCFPINGSSTPAPSSTKTYVIIPTHHIHPPKPTTIFSHYLSTKPTTTNHLLTKLTARPSITPTTTIPPATPSTTRVPLASPSPTPATTIPSAMPLTKYFTTSLTKSTRVDYLPTSPTKPATLVPSVIPSTKPTNMATVLSTDATITSLPGVHSTTVTQATGINSTTGTILDDLSNTSYTPINASEIESIISKIEHTLSAQKIEPKAAREMVNTISNLLNAPHSLVSPMSKRIIKIVDAIGLKLNFSTESINFTSPALALAVIKVNSSGFSKMSFAVQDSSDLQIALGTQAPINSVGAIALPSSLLTNLPSEDVHLASRIIFNFFEKTTPFQDPSLKNLSLISNVISSSVANLTLSDLKTNITVTLQNTIPNQENLTVRCAFWDFNVNGGNGGWSYEGCMVKERRANETVCTCNHLTSFGVLLDLSRDTTIPPMQTLVLTFITYIGCGLSAVFLSVTLVTYIAFEKIRRDYPSKILIQLCAALLLLNLVFLLDSWIALYNIRGLCITVAVLLHYFLLVSFTWMGLEAFHMYLALVKVFNTYVRKYILKFCIVGWGVPLVVVAIVLAITPNNYGLGSYGKFPNGSPDEFCWIKNNIVFYITVVGYFCMIFLLNVSMFIVVLIQLCRIKKKKQLGTQRKTSIQDLRSVAGLTFLLGITWGFAFFAWGPVNLIFMYLFAIFNTLQGFFIFIFYCVAKENVLKQWRRYLCCGKFRLAENSDWSRTATNGLKKQTVNQGVSSSSNSLQSNSNSTNSTTLLMNNDYSVHANGNGNVASEKNGVSFNVQNGDVCLQNFSGKQFIFHEKDDADHKRTRVSLRRTSKRGSLHFIKQM